MHLRIAENLLAHIGDWEPHAFAVGNVAPDSGVPDENWEHFDPPTEVTHFDRQDCSWPCADLEFYRRCLAPPAPIEPYCASFRWGYFLHLVTDNLWVERIARPTRQRFLSEYRANPRYIHQVKRDWYGLDFQYVRAHPDSLFWTVFLKCQYTADCIDFLPAHAIQRNLDYIKCFYQRTDEEIERVYIRRPELYLSEAEMDTFVEGATDRLVGIYRRLSTAEAATGGSLSCLDSLPPHEAAAPTIIHRKGVP